MQLLVLMVVDQKNYGHTALNDIISATFFDTGKVLDAEIMSKVFLF